MTTPALPTTPSDQPAVLPLTYLAGYPPEVLEQVRRLLVEDRLGEYLRRRYPQRHTIQSDKALHAYIAQLKQAHLRNAPAIDRAFYDKRLDVAGKVLGLHTAISRVQGARLKAKKEIRIAAVFRQTPPEFLQMIVVHELAHLKEAEHNKAFYRLCTHMAPDYHQWEFDLRVYLTWRELEEAGAT